MSGIEWIDTGYSFQKAMVGRVLELHIGYDGGWKATVGRFAIKRRFTDRDEAKRAAEDAARKLIEEAAALFTQPKAED